jgi:hypothetical protein
MLCDVSDPVVYVSPCLYGPHPDRNLYSEYSVEKQANNEYSVYGEKSEYQSKYANRTRPLPI